MRYIHHELVPRKTDRQTERERETERCTDITGANKWGEVMKGPVMKTQLVN